MTSHDTVTRISSVLAAERPGRVRPGRGPCPGPRRKPVDRCLAGVALSIPMVMVQQEMPGGVGVSSSVYGAVLQLCGADRRGDHRRHRRTSRLRRRAVGVRRAVGRRRARHAGPPRVPPGRITRAVLACGP